MGIIKTVYVLIILETIARELDYQLVLSSELINCGFTPILISQSSINQYLSRFPKSIIIDKGAGFPHKSFFESASRLNHKIFVLDTEQIVYFINEDIHKRNAILDMPTASFVVGSKFKNELIHHDSFSKLIITGHPSIDLLNRNLEYYTAEDDYSSDVLIIDSFSELEPTENYSHSLVQKLISENHSSEALNISKSHQYFLYLNAIESLIRHFGNYKFLIRIHPTNKSNEWLLIKKKFKNVRISKRRSVREDIYYSKLIIHPGSTSGVEAYFMEKPNIYFANPEITHNPHIFDLVSRKAETTENLIDLVSNMIISHYLIDSQGFNSFELSEIIYNCKPSVVASELIAGYLKKYKDEFISHEIISASIVEIVTVRSLFYFRRLFSHISKGTFEFDKVKGFNKKNLNRLLDRMNKFSLITVELYVDEILPEVFVIKGKS